MGIKCVNKIGLTSLCSSTEFLEVEQSRTVLNIISSINELQQKQSNEKKKQTYGVRYWMDYLWCQILDGLTLVTFYALPYSTERSNLSLVVTPCEHILKIIKFKKLFKEVLRCQNFFTDFQDNINKDNSVDNVSKFQQQRQVLVTLVDGKTFFYKNKL